jgi:hypothetical protein
MVGKYYKTKEIFKLIKITKISYFYFRTENMSYRKKAQNVEIIITIISTSYVKKQFSTVLHSKAVGVEPNRGSVRRSADIRKEPQFIKCLSKLN